MSGNTEVEKLLVKIGGDHEGFKKAAVESIGLMSAMELKALGIGAALSLGVTLPLAALGGSAVREFASFDDAMVKSTAIMGDLSDTTIASMNEQALALSRIGTASADQLAESYFFLASAGLNAEQAMKALPQVQSFAAAGAFDLATATDLATDAQSALGLTSKDAEENLVNLTRVTDVLVGANTLANASVEQFAQSLTRKAGAALRSVNKDVEEGVAVLAAYADQGIKGANAGEKVTAFLREMQMQSRKNSTAFKQLGLEVHNASGELLPMADLVKGLEDVLDGMSTKQREATLATLGFRAEAQAAILPLIGMSEHIRNLDTTLRNVNGIVKEVAGKQLQSFSAQVKIMHNNLSAVLIDIGSSLVPVLKVLNNVIIMLTSVWFSINKHVRTFVVIVGLAAAAIGPLMVAVVLIKAAFVLFAPIVMATVGSLVAFIATTVAAVVGITTLRNSLVLAAPPMLLLAGTAGVASGGFLLLGSAVWAALTPLLLIAAAVGGILTLIVGVDGMSEAFEGLKLMIGGVADSGIDDMKRLENQIKETLGDTSFESSVSLAGIPRSTNFKAAEAGTAQAFRQARISEQMGSQTSSIQQKQLEAMEQVAESTEEINEKQPDKPVSTKQIMLDNGFF